MPPDRTALRTPAAIERRPAVVATVQRKAAAPAPSPARALQERLGNQATQTLVARSIAAQAKETAKLPAKVSKPNEPAELEAEEAARKVTRMPEPPATKPAAPKETVKSTIQRTEATPSPRAAAPPSLAHVSIPGGSPLPSSVRGFMEPRFGASFANVRIHTGESAARQSADLNAHAFTVGEHVFFGRDKFQPQSASGRELIAHELTHTIQQGAAVQRDIVHRSSEVEVTEHVGPHVQRSFLGIPNPREYFASKAANIPGFTMLTVVIGFNPITNTRVDRSPGNILRAAIQLIPGGKFITDALDAHGVFDKVSVWAATQFETLKDIGSSIWQDIENFLNKFSVRDLADPGGLWDRAKAIVERRADQVKAFATGLKDGIVALIKEAILKPIAAFARTTSGYPLLCTVMGKDPITGETVPQDAEALLGGFMKFIGEEELWATMQKAKAIPRAFAWFKDALNALRGFVNEIPGLFVQAFKSLEVVDIILIPRAFLKLAGVFGNFAVRFVTWGANAVWTLLEIIFDVVSPGALAYIKKTGAALKSILRNPLPFVGNLVKAAKLGFSNFADRFLDHLKAGLIDWLTGALPSVYIPKAFSLTEIAKFVFSVLGLTWANIRQKLVKATSETVVKAMETGFDIVVTLVREGPAAAWDKIKEQLSNLKDMVIGGITDFVVDMVVKKAIPKLIAMFIPGAGFISAILSIYDTIMVFVNKISKIIQVVTGFIDSIVAIASGAIGAAATRVENTLAGLLSLAINFLAGFAGLGNVADKVMAVIQKIRAPIDKALDWLVGWIVALAKKLGKFVAQAGVPQDPKERFNQGMEMAEKAVNRFAGKKVGKVVLTPLLTGIKVRYGFQVLDVVASGKTWWIEGVLNPAGKKRTNVSVEDIDAASGTKEKKMPLMTVSFLVKKSIHEAKDQAGVSLLDHYEQQLLIQQNKLVTLTIQTWMGNIAQFYGDTAKGIVKKGRSKEGDKIAQQIRDRLVFAKAKDLMTKDGKLSRDAAIAKARDHYSDQAVLHLLDQAGGGGGTEFLGDVLKGLDKNATDEVFLGSGRVDFAIGASWPARARELKKNIDDRVDPSAFPTEKMNVKLKGVKSP